MPSLHSGPAGGPIAQLGYVVGDVITAMDVWLRDLDVGPFFYLPSPPLHDLRYRGEPTSARIAVALTYSGDLQIELIQPLDDHPSPYRDFMAARGSGLHHVARFPEEYDAALETWSEKGRRPYFQGRGLSEDQRFAYFDPDAHGGTVSELVETAGLAGFFGYMRDTCATWDGSDPVRVIGTRTP
ncbi:MAG: VOC family protein [Acidimicrobiales bacterium]|jgi:hypothetical protein